MNQNGFADIIIGAFDAALNDELWSSWFLSLAKALGGTGSVAFVIDAEQRAIERPIALWSPAKAIDEYLGGYCQNDPQIPIASSFEGLGTFTDLHDTDIADPAIVDYLKWQRSVANSGHHMTAVIPLSSGAQRLAFCIHRAPELGPTPKQRQQALNKILPEVQRAAVLGFRHSELLQDTFWNGIVVGRADEVAFLLDERSRVIRHTDAAARLVSNRDGLDITGGRLRPVNLAEDPCFQVMMGQAVEAVSPRSGAMRLNRPSGKSPLILVWYPLQRSSRMLAPARAAALLTVIDPNARHRSPSEIYRQAFNLTIREAEVAVALLDGHSIDSTAAFLGMSIATARTHMRRLYEKTGVSGHRSLTQLLARVA